MTSGKVKSALMSNTAKVEYCDAKGNLKELYDEILSTLEIETLPNWVIYLGKNEGVLRGIWSIFQNVALKGTLNTLLQELIIFSVSKANGSPYCAEFHASQILRMTSWLDYNQLIDILEGDSRDHISERFHIAVEVITNHSKNGCTLQPDELKRLEAAGFSEKDILELAGLSSLALAFNMLTMAADIPIEKQNKLDGFHL